MSSSWILGSKSKHEQQTSSSSTSTEQGSSSVSVEGGLLSIRLIEARSLILPEGVELAANVKSRPSSMGGPGMGSAQRKRESVQRSECSHLPYVILTFDRNEVVIDPLGGSLTNPSYLFQTAFDVSRRSEIGISAYLRNASIKPYSASGGHQRKDSQSGRDVFLGSAVLHPVFDPRKQSDMWYPASNGSGEFRLQIAFQPSRHEALTIDAFELLKVVGKGSFGKVMQVRKKDTNRIYALKTIRKAHIVSRSEVVHTLAERTVLAQVTSPFIVPLKFSFQSTEKLYLVLAYVNGGELFHHLQNEGRFEEERARFYAAELLSALDHLHQFNVVYRDLKPENILLDMTGHLMLCDFGLCKLNMAENERTNTFAGTPEYLAPELVEGQGYTRTVDWWTLGVLLYEMLSGLPPFYEEDHQKMYNRIVHEQLSFPPFIVGSARDICTGLLQKNPAHRLGANGANEIRRHLFFHGLDWALLERRGIEPMWKPDVENAIDTSNVDSEFLAEPALDSVVEDSHLSESAQDAFRGFTYEAPSGLESVR
ncbi:putative Serine/threonine-protein kinase gad8 [Leucosporidium creatinivorum]|uniref:non-specific serine/threonine protein kinase n=1 Tax=Leucosporidium creatinivorum TaxID=106004 RepID=A0A1Y2ERR7_9BASI|nr:putative Serine/threonine-protein kinase gad8 [Leucosporidium creatinivorum]